MTRYATIAGVGSSLPPRLVPNTWFETIVETNDEWIRDRTGIEARHFADEGTDTSDLAVEAARRAMESAGVTPEQLDMIIVATITGDTIFPATAVWVQQKLGVRCPSFDVNAACAGFSYGLSSANAFITSGMADTILLIGAEVFSRILDYTDRGTCILFGDGAGAAVVRASETPGFEGAVLGADGSAAEILWMPAGGTRTPASDGHGRGERSHGAHAERSRGLQARGDRDGGRRRELLEKSGLSIDDVDVLIPHQANARIMGAVVERLGIDPAKAIVDVAEVGNTSAASIPVALDRAWRDGTDHARATWCCSPRSAPGSRGAPRWCGGRCTTQPGA